MQQVEFERGSQIDDGPYHGACFLVLCCLNLIRAKLDSVVHRVDCKLRDN